MNSTEETEVQCPVCRGRGSVQVTDGSGARREEPCPLCRGRGKVTQRRVRRLFERMSRRYPLHGLRQPHPRPAGGGRFRPPSSVRLPLSMDPRASADDGLPGPEPSYSEQAWRPIDEPEPYPAPGIGLAKTERPDDSEEPTDEPVSPDEPFPPEQLEFPFEGPPLNENVTRAFPLADPELEARPPAQPEVRLDAGAAFETTLDGSKDGLLVGPLYNPIEPGPLAEDIQYGPLDAGPLGTEPDPGKDLLGPHPDDLLEDA